MAIDQKRKAACQAAIHAHIAQVGAGGWDPLRHEFEDVSPATFWRLVKAGKAQALAGKAKSINARTDPLAGDGLHTAAASLPAVPSIGDLCAAAIDPQAVLAACLKNAAEVVEHSKAADGKIRSPKLLLQASKAMTEVLRTAAQVSSTLLDERQARSFYRAITEALEAESPQLKSRVLDRLEALNADLGLKSYVGR